MTEKKKNLAFPDKLLLFVISIILISLSIVIFFVWQWKKQANIPQQNTREMNSSSQKAWIGVYVSSFSEINRRSGKYTANFYIWLRTNGEKKPANYEFVYGNIIHKERIEEKDVEGFYYFCDSCRVEFDTFYDLSSFPIENHRLKIIVEDDIYETKTLEYVADIENSKIDEDLYIEGWKLGQVYSHVENKTYQTNYGNPELKSSVILSRYVFTLEISRSGVGIYLKTFLPLFISVCIAFLSFIIPPVNIESRFGVGIAAVFGVLSSMIVTAEILPETSYFTLSDITHVIGLSFVFLSMFCSCISLELYRKGEAIDKFDRSLGLFLLCCFVIVIIITTILYL